MGLHHPITKEPPATWRLPPQHLLSAHLKQETMSNDRNHLPECWESSRKATLGSAQQYGCCTLSPPSLSFSGPFS